MNRRNKLTEDVTERRRQEDESPRLLAVVPRLQSLRLELSEARGEGQIEHSHIKRIAVEHAPSVFVIACGEPRCKHGGFDLTDTLLASLRRGEARVVATDTCRGEVGTAQCDRVLRCTAVAEYAPG
jgi:hypothetical protein